VFQKTLVQGGKLAGVRRLLEGRRKFHYNNPTGIEMSLKMFCLERITYYMGFPHRPPDKGDTEGNCSLRSERRK
jgi:hypothetical protein